MENFIPKPYKIIGKIQNYKWGTKNNNAFIPQFLGIEPKKDLPYAELWYGTHPNAPSEVLFEGEQISLATLIERYPQNILGKRVTKKFDSKLPFLFKILSINQALSIQSHPNKILAKILHNNNPNHYPDDNHKPEIAIALDNLVALVGLKPKELFKSTIKNNPEIKLLLSLESLSELESAKITDKLVKKIYSDIMNANESKLNKCIEDIKRRLEKKAVLDPNEEQFLIQYSFYKNDVGLISILLFNMVNLESGQAIFTPAGIPHAYIKGNIIECMANSDNVVRAGLTDKYKDVKTLLNMLELDNSQSVVDIYERENQIIYKTIAEEFELSKLMNIRKTIIKNNEDLKFFLVLNGTFRIELNGKNYEYTRGECCMIPAALSCYSLSMEPNSEVYKVCVPK